MDLKTVKIYLLGVILGIFTLYCSSGQSKQQLLSTTVFLSKIAHIESSNGKHTNHKVIKKGMHKGDSALGTYGLMPNTIDYIINKYDFAFPCEDARQWRVCQKRWAEAYASQILKKYDNYEMAAYAWLFGHNISKEQMIERDYLNNYYVKRYRSLK